MRILANYGYRGKRETYSVSLEMMGDVSKQNIEGTVDELFNLAKEAIKRQIGNKNPEEETKGNQPKDESPATKKQVNLIIRLAKEKGKFIENPGSLTINEASQTIEELMTA